MKWVLFLVAFFGLGIVILSCASKKESLAPVVRTSIDPGTYAADDILLANGVFRPYADERPELVCDGDLQVLITIPELGVVDLLCERQTHPSYGFVATWIGQLTVTYQCLVSLDSYGRIFFAVTDGGSDGKSNSIGWRFDPPRG